MFLKCLQTIRLEVNTKRECGLQSAKTVECVRLKHVNFERVFRRDAKI